MIIQITDLEKLLIRLLSNAGYSRNEIPYILKNIIFAEASGKITHGIVRIPYLIDNLKNKKINSSESDIQIVRESAVSVLIDGQMKTGLYVLNKAVEIGIAKAKKSGMVIVGVTNTSPISGMIGQYAYDCTKENLIFIGFNNSSGGLAPHGSIDRILGTNPITIGINSSKFPIILDMASSKTTYGQIFLAKALGQNIPDDVAMDIEGNPTTDPELALQGSLVPFGGHKGSGLGVIVELLGGALTNSRCGFDIKGGWGSSFVLIDPSILIDLEQFKNNVDSLVKEIKNSRKQKGFDEIFLPGEQSYYKRQSAFEKNELEIDEKLYEELKKYLD